MGLATRGAAVLLLISAIGLGFCCLIAIRSLATTGRIAFLFGYPTFGHGGFERHGEATTVPLLIAFLAVCLVEAAAGWLLWQGRMSGALLAVAVLPAGGLFWWGFDLPYPPVLAVVRTLLIAASWRALATGP